MSLESCNDESLALACREWNAVSLCCLDDWEVRESSMSVKELASIVQRQVAYDGMYTNATVYLTKEDVEDDGIELFRELNAIQGSVLRLGFPMHASLCGDITTMIRIRREWWDAHCVDSSFYILLFMNDIVIDRIMFEDLDILSMDATHVDISWVWNVFQTSTHWNDAWVCDERLSGATFRVGCSLDLFADASHSLWQCACRAMCVNDESWASIRCTKIVRDIDGNCVVYYDWDQTRWVVLHDDLALIVRTRIHQGKWEGSGTFETSIQSIMESMLLEEECHAEQMTRRIHSLELSVQTYLSEHDVDCT